MTSIFMKKLIFFFLQHLTDETISNRETFASDSDDLAMTCDEDPQESGAAVHEDDGNSVRETWFSKMLRDLTPVSYTHLTLPTKRIV